MPIIESVASKFKELFRETPLLVRSPGRVNLIGEHTDYNDGYVLPAAIDEAMYFAIAPNGGNECRVHALNLNAEHRFTIGHANHSDKRWPNYLMGVVEQFNNAGYRVGGFNCVFGGDIPIGAGMSSSAALETGLAFALDRLFALKVDALALVKLAQKAENEFVGVECGIMDQYINIFGKRGNALRIDCRTLESELVSFHHPAAIVLFDAGVSHSLAGSGYNKRRVECSAGVAAVKQKHPAVTHLRDVSIAMLSGCKGLMDATVYRRSKYVVEENDRVFAACAALARNDLTAFGALLYASHEGLSREYEVSCAELDVLVDVVREMPGVYGARMMGGGFGGCTINLIQPDAVELVSTAVRKQYAKKFGREPKVYVTSISDGTSIVVP
ncbi:MAG: galactokinase [Ignavibacteriae bacterium]|nr:galactokinase [Ignavibacteriota bacterium]